MCAGSPRLGVLRRLRPAPDRSAVDAPSPRTRWTRASRARSGTVPVFTVVRSTKEEPDYAPAASLRVRRSLSSQPPWQLMPTAAGVPRQYLTGARRLQPRSTRFRAGAASRGCHTPVPRVLLSVPLAEPRPSGSADRSRRCQGCSHPPRHHPDQAALSSTALLRQDQRRRSLTSTRTTAPHGARTTHGTQQLPCCCSWASQSAPLWKSWVGRTRRWLRATSTSRELSGATSRAGSVACCGGQLRSKLRPDAVG